MFKWISVAISILEWVLPILAKRKLGKADKVVGALTDAIEVYDDVKKVKADKKLTTDNKVDAIKTMANDLLEDSGAKKYVEKKFATYRDKAKSGVEKWVDRVIGKAIKK